MNKYSILAVLALLSACGGGGGGGDNEPVIPTLPGTPASSAGDIFNASAISVLEGSGMAGVTDEGDATLKLLNDGHNVVISGNYIPVDKFNTAGMALNYGDEIIAVPHDQIPEPILEKFPSAAKYKEMFTSQMGGKSAGLQYAEFGYWNNYGMLIYNANEKYLGVFPGEDPARVFAVGDASKVKDLASGNFTFTGDAYISVRWPDADIAVDGVKGTAQLVFNNGVHNLNANFNYNGSVALACNDCSNASTSTFTFNAYGTPYTYAKDKHAAKFYGDSEATEAVGVLSGHNNDSKLSMSFGAKR